MNFGLTPQHIEKINSVFEQIPQIEKVIIYGSRAKGHFRTGSDIDLTLIGKNINLHLLNQITSKLDDLLLPYLIDISIFDKIDNKDLKAHIDRVGLEFYNKES